MFRSEVWSCSNPEAYASLRPPGLVAGARGSLIASLDGCVARRLVCRLPRWFCLAAGEAPSLLSCGFAKWLAGG